jgi:4-carboxymuconolactone decarboxylase
MTDRDQSGNRPRIAPASPRTPEEADLLGKTLLDPTAEPLNVFRTLLNHPQLLKRFNALGGLLMTRGDLDPRFREIAILRVAERAGSTYEFAQHTPLAMKYGLSDDEIESLRSGGIGGRFTGFETDLVAAVDELLETSDVSDPVWAALEAELSVPEILELLVLVGFYRMLAGVLNAARVELEPSAREESER